MHHVAQYDACSYQAPANSTGAFFSPSYFKPQQRWPPRTPPSCSYLRSRGFAALPPCCNLNYFGETVLYVTVIRQSITVYAQSAPRAAGRGSLPPSCCDRSGQENRPATR
ncbi:hypothetical protein EUQ28_16785 [Salmonella enterica subsp. enterica serovar Millesi]|nr:hypothetical protein [Salmonella enterica subsp. enterica serovar Millesi]ECA5755091.1 hypothetical protein [Salmonella enterica subsp. enterica serovar Millesi]ECA9832898.1 hypothetical protein [Salmonella enterica subsp. enterica serovar Millesi]EED9380902.1 hypothetical protein [Salmonella enterica subsp. enterica]